MDEDNHSLAQRIAESCGVLLIPVRSMQVSGKNAASARLHDLDHVLPCQKARILEELLEAAPATPVAVHGYSLAEAEVVSLRDNGVIVARALDRSLIRRLCDISELDQGPLRIECDGDARESEEPFDPARLGTLVRSLASRAHHTLTMPTRNRFGDLSELDRELDTLQGQLDQLWKSHGLRFAELHRWLDRVRQLVEQRGREQSGMPL
jgi:hypothetical protein